MKTDIIKVSSREDRIASVLQQVDKVSVYKELSHRQSMHLRLLAEEMMGMMRSITGETEGKFWIEDQDDEYRLHLQVKSRLSSEKREKLLSASSSGRNESAKGLMGRLRDFFDWGSDEELASYSGLLYSADMYEHSTSPALDLEWSMRRYESELSARMQQNDAAALEAWDELEKSVVTHVADDIKVYIRNGTVEMVILKKLA